MAVLAALAGMIPVPLHAEETVTYEAGSGITITDGTETDAAKKISVNRSLYQQVTGTDSYNSFKNNGLILGGETNFNSGYLNFGGYSHGAVGTNAVTVGGYNLIAKGKDSVVMGGYNTQASGARAVAIGGRTNGAEGDKYGARGEDSVLVGGLNNNASGSQSVVVGGELGKASAQKAVVNGGQRNTASGNYSSVFGGSHNTASANTGAVIGGQYNTASGMGSSLVAGGMQNTASGGAAFVAGGGLNIASGNYSAIVGGDSNRAVGVETFMAGGSTNYAGADYAAILGGDHNFATGVESNIIGASMSTASGIGSLVLGGSYTNAMGMGSIALGGATTGTNASGAIAIGSGAAATLEGALAVGTGATADTANTISFGHNEGDTYYTVTWQQLSGNQTAEDGTRNDYSKTPTVSAATYGSAEYNRLVKIADGQDAHDAVIMKQLTQYEAGDNVALSDDGTDETTEQAKKKISVNVGDGLESVNNTITAKADGTNILVSSNGIALNAVLTGLTSASFGTEGTILNASGLTISTGGTKELKFTSSGISAGGLQIKNVKDGTDPQDAVTMKQLVEYSVGNNDPHISIQTDMDPNADGQTVKRFSIKTDGRVVHENQGILTGGTVHSEVRPESDGAYVKADQTTAANLTALDTQIGTIPDRSSSTPMRVRSVRRAAALSTSSASTGYNYINTDATVSQNLVNLDERVKADIQSVSGSTVNIDMNNITEEGKTVIKNLTQSAVAVKAGTGVTVSSAPDSTGRLVYTVNATGTSSGGSPVVQVKAGTNVTVDENSENGNKEYTVNVLGDGKVEDGNTGLLSGGTLYAELRPEDGHFIQKATSTAGNLTALDTRLAATEDLIREDPGSDTIRIGGGSSAAVIDISRNTTDSAGRVVKESRTITGVETDTSDDTSAANVAYVNEVNARGTQQVYHDMRTAYHKTQKDISRAAAGANALAALHPLDMDLDNKLQFAVGFGHYRDANAAAVGAFYTPNEDIMVSVGASMGTGDAGFNAGLTFRVGSHGQNPVHAMSKKEMVQIISSQSSQIRQMQEADAEKDRRISSLEAENKEIREKLEKILARLGD